MTRTRRGCLTGLFARPIAPSPAASPAAGRIPNVPVLTDQGKAVHFYDDLFRGKTVLFNFMYAHCTKICPRSTANLVNLQHSLGNRVGRDIFMYSITLQPELDTPDVLRHYMRLFHVGPGWRFLTGKPEDVERLRRRLGFVNPNPALDRDITQHIGIIRYGIEPRDRWGACPALSSPQQIRFNLLSMV
jgi:protein SCO1/2